MIVTAVLLSGCALLVRGLLRVFGVLPTSIEGDSEQDKRLFSETNRYFIGRYWSGAQEAIAGFGLIGFAIIMLLS